MKDKKRYDYLKNKYKDEEVFVILTDSISNIKDGFSKEKHDNSIFRRYREEGKFIKRYDAEEDCTFQQIIPYVLIANEDESKYFITQRIQGDSRLQNKLSIGLGGHINPCDFLPTQDYILANICREIHEEAYVEYAKPIKYLGTIREISSSTNDHLGLLFKLQVKEETAKILEVDTLKGIWMTPKELYDNYSKFEGWAKIVINYILENRS